MTDVLQSNPAEEMEPAQPAQRGKFHLFKVAGINVTIDYSWLIIFALVFWSLSAGYFPRHFPGGSPAVYWPAGLVAALLFFASILVHELSHSIVAVRSGLKIPEITLFIFGGVAHLSEEPDNPKLEFKIAVAGPVASFVLAVLFRIVEGVLTGVAPLMVVAVFDYLSWINVALGVFNLVPGYPLDGGRILRAAVWWKTGSVVKATKWASLLGKGFAWALMFLGILQVFSGSLIGGLWLLFIGMFLNGLAATGYQETMVKQSLEGVSVGDVMVEEVITVPPDLSLDEVAQRYFLKYGHGGFPVVEGGRPVGLICLGNIKDTPEEERHSTTAREAMISISPGIEIQPKDTLVAALTKMSQSGVGRLIVMRGDTMIGMITKNGLMRFLEIKQVLALQ